MGQKRRRLALSCVDCRRRKVRCDRTYPSCIRCQKGGYGDKCLYVSHTGPDNASIGLPTPEDERRRRSRSGSANTWADEAQQYEEAAHHNKNVVQQKLSQPIPGIQDTTGATSQPPANEALPMANRKIAQLQGRLIELETMVYAAGGKPTSNEMYLGLLNPMGPGATGDRNYYSDQYKLADQEKALLRGKAFKTQYFGPSNGFAILLQMEDLSKFVKEILLALPSLASHKYAISKLRQKEKEAAKQPYDVSVDTLVKMVPDRAYTDRLLHLYFDTIETTYRIIHVPTFLKAYEAYWYAPSAAKPEFIIQLLVCLSMTCCIASGGEEGYVGRSSAKRELASYWINVASYWLDRQSQKHVSLVDYQLHVQLWLSKCINTIKVKRYWTDSGALVRRFMAAGFHREPSVLSSKVNSFECEMRRRLWYTVLELDLQITIDRGMTPTIGAMDWDTNPPRNIDDESFNPDSDELPDAKPRGNFTRTSFLAWAAESLPLRIEILYKINSIRNALEFNTIIAYDHKIRHIMDEIPLAGWQEAVFGLTKPSTDTNPLASETLGVGSGSNSVPHPSSLPSSTIPITLSQSIFYEFLTILHQPFPTDATFKSAHFHSRVARRYACIATLLLLNPQLSTTGPEGMDNDVNSNHQMYHLNEIQRRFLIFTREDHFRAAMSLAHSYVVSRAPQSDRWLPYVADDMRLFSLIAAEVDMLEDLVSHLGQGFHGYWLASSTLSFVHSKQSPAVPRSTFARAAADRVLKLHGKVMDGQLPHAKRMMLPMGGALARSITPSVDGGDADAADDDQMQTVDQISSVQGAIDLKETAGSKAIQNAMNNFYGGPTMIPESGGALDMDVNTDFQTGVNGGEGNTLEDVMFGFENMDWDQLMNTDPMAFMMEGFDYPS